MEVVRYTKEYFKQWNDFLGIAKNSTFLFDRNFCEYHADRFQDHSLLLLQNNKLVALFVANQIGEEIYSHSGLTYGGLIISNEIKLSNVLECFYSLLNYYNNLGIKKIIYKQMPAFYHSAPTFEDDYALFLANAILIRRDTSFVVDLRKPIYFQQRRIRNIKKAQKEQVTMIETSEFGAFWNEILIPNLENRFGVKPVHSLQEITSLQEKFPQNIRQFNAILDNKIIAGATIFENNKVAHAQYIASNDLGKNNGALDLLFAVLIQDIYKNFDYFSFGISNEQQGKILNQGLADWKEGFGANVWIHNFYEIKPMYYTNISTYKSN
jgi:hypothetical protein